VNYYHHSLISFLLDINMKSVQIKRYGSSEVMEINHDETVINPTAGKVLVSIKFAGINPIDWKIREGYMEQSINLQFPLTLGMDFSGAIKQVGEGKEVGQKQGIEWEFKQGDEVYGQASVTSGGSGAFAELAITNIESIAHAPKSLSQEEAAALPLVGVSAWQALVENMNLSNGQKILIHGGAGGIGSIAIQLAKNLGAYVATTASSDDKEFVQALGADKIIDYKTEKFEDLIKDYDRVYDTIGGETYKRSFKVLKRDDGIIVSMLEQPDLELIEEFKVKAVFQFTIVNRERLTQLAQWVDKNNIKVNVEKAFSLDEAAKALDYVKDVHPRGKVVFEI
jgi:alcohol dehydrogenase